MSDILVKRYVTALFEVALENKQLSQISQNFSDFDQQLKTNSELSSILKNPSVGKNKKRELIEGIFKDDSVFFRNFIRLLIEKNRTEVIFSSYKLFNELEKEHLGIVSCIVESATELGSETRKRVVDFIEKSFSKKVELTEKVSPELIGGLKIRIGNSIIDNSVQYNLKRLHKSLSGVN